jgi:catechol 2,3-dioxygenase-like lactoylglutathione lyase family enzyme
MEGVSMEIRKLGHASLLVEDVDRSRHFYSQVLGMQEVPRPSTMTVPGAWFRKGSAEIHLVGEAEPGRAAQVQPGYRQDEIARGHGTHIAFEVDDLEKARRHMRTYGVETVGEPRPRGDGVMQMYICDPDGYMVELYVWPK